MLQQGNTSIWPALCPCADTGDLHSNLGMGAAPWDPDRASLPFLMGSLSEPLRTAKGELCYLQTAPRGLKETSACATGLLSPPVPHQAWLLCNPPSTSLLSIHYYSSHGNLSSSSLSREKPSACSKGSWNTFCFSVTEATEVSSWDGIFEIQPSIFLETLSPTTTLGLHYSGPTLAMPAYPRRGAAQAAPHP